MHREIHAWWSPHLNKNMEIAVYGHYGFALLMLPTAAAAAVVLNSLDFNANASI